MDLIKLNKYLTRNKESELCVVFDLGSKSARILIGPRITKYDLIQWDPFRWFFIDSMPFELMSTVKIYSRRMPIDNNVNLENTIKFINEYKIQLLQIGVSLENIVLVGTEVYRDLVNQSEIIDHIKTKTGFNLTILKKESEAFLSLLALTHTYSYPSPGIEIPNVRREDIILLFDQGGGSTEISYYEVNDEKFGDQSSISQIGTSSLRELFFNYGADGNEIDPLKNHSKISTQFDNVDLFVKLEIDKEFDRQDELKRVSKISKNVVPFAMGSAILKCLEDLYKQAPPARPTYGPSLNCKSISVSEVAKVLKEKSASIESDSQEVRVLYEKVSDITKYPKLEGRLLLLYGLPVYLKLMAKFNLTSIRYSYFNLKHGVFLAKYYYNLPDVNVTSLPGTSDIKYFDSRNGNLVKEIISRNNKLTQSDFESIVILTALPKELTEMKKYFPDSKPEIINKVNYDACVSQFGNKKFKIILKVTGKNNNASLKGTLDAINNCRPKYIFYLGIAGKLKDVEIGDVVAADIVENYEQAKAGQVLLPRGIQSRASDYLRDLAFVIASEVTPSWQNRIKLQKHASFVNNPKLFVDRIASGEKVLGEVDTEIYKYIRNNFSACLAVECEGSGFYYACKDQDVKGLLIRGISDKLKDKHLAEEFDSQEYASACAAAFLFELINKLD